MAITMNIRPIKKEEIPTTTYNHAFKNMFDSVIDEFLESDSEALRFFDDRPDCISVEEWARETKRVYNNLAAAIKRRDLGNKLAVSNRCQNVWLMKKEEGE